MDRKQFSVRFTNAIELVVPYTQKVCFNDFYPNYQFIVSPNSGTTPVVLDAEELKYIKTLKNLHLKPQSFDEVLDLIQVGDRWPLWINISAYKSEPDRTLIELVCARRLRKIENTSNNVDKYPPFHVWVAIPPAEYRVVQNDKFDINWRSAAENEKGLFSRIVGYFSHD